MTFSVKNPLFFLENNSASLKKLTIFDTSVSRTIDPFLLENKVGKPMTILFDCALKKLKFASLSS